MSIFLPIEKTETYGYKLMFIVRNCARAVALVSTAARKCAIASGCRYQTDREKPRAF
jgi:hypothetical protein